LQKEKKGEGKSRMPLSGNHVVWEKDEEKEGEKRKPCSSINQLLLIAEVTWPENIRKEGETVL